MSPARLMLQPLEAVLDIARGFSPISSIMNLSPEAMDSLTLPVGAWNCHLHCFDVVQHPLKPTRAYTPEAAPPDDLLDNVLAANAMIVQASVEDGYSGVLDAIRACRQMRPSSIFRGTLQADLTLGKSLSQLESVTFDEMHEAGIRCIRIHGSYGGSGNDLGWVKELFLLVARLHPVQKYNWSIAAQLPLQTWSAIASFLMHNQEFENVRIIADHNGSAMPCDFGSPEMDGFLQLLASEKLFVKIGALHRRSPKDVRLMKPIIQKYAESGPNQILWGSDWPHVDTRHGGLSPTPPLRPDTLAELEIIHSCMSEQKWINMLTGNPARLFN